jgi:hypothetical protein
VGDEIALSHDAQQGARAQEETNTGGVEAVLDAQERPTGELAIEPRSAIPEPEAASVRIEDGGLLRVHGFAHESELDQAKAEARVRVQQAGIERSRAPQVLHRGLMSADTHRGDAGTFG